MKIEPGRPYLEHDPDGYLEGDKDYLLNNREAAVALLDGYLTGELPVSVPTKGRLGAQIAEIAYLVFLAPEDEAICQDQRHWEELEKVLVENGAIEWEFEAAHDEFDAHIKVVLLNGDLARRDPLIAAIEEFLDGARAG